MLEELESALQLRTSSDDLGKMVKDLQLHQLELELQNRELREAHLELESSRSEYADLYDFAPIGYVTLDEHFVIRQLNTVGASLLGAAREIHIGMPFTLYFDKSERRLFRNYLRHCRETGKVETIELHLQAKGGASLDVELHCSVMPDASLHRSANYRIAIADVSDRKRVEGILREKTSEMKAMYRREQRIALSFQEASLPKCLPDIPGVIFHRHYEPGISDALVGGDWYDAFCLPDGKVVISIGDVCGSGLKAAVIMAGMRQVIRGIGYVHPDPLLMLNAADKALQAEHPNTIVTAFVGIFDPIERTLTYASAGHPPPFLRLCDGTIEELSYHGLVLGLSGHTEPPAKRMIVPDKSCIVLYTDGLTESKRDYGEGEFRLQTALADPLIHASENIAKGLRDTVLYDGGRDDVAILVVEFPALEVGEKQRLLRWELDSGDAVAARTARLEYTERLRSQGMSFERVAMAELVFLELLSNVARYAPGMVTIWMECGDSSLRLHFIDRGHGFHYRSALPSNILSESGRGLYLISMLTKDFYVSKAFGGGSHACALL